MKSYYICPVVGDGLTLQTAYRAKIQDYGVNHVAIIPNDATGKPKYAWCLVHVAAADHTAILADVDMKALPVISLDAKLSTLTNKQRTALLSLAQSKGIDTSSFSVNSTFREVLSAVGKYLELSFDENGFDASE